VPGADVDPEGVSALPPHNRERDEQPLAFDVTTRVAEARACLAASSAVGADVAVLYRDRLVGIVPLDRLANARADLSLACVMNPPTPERLIADIFETVDGPPRTTAPTLRSAPAAAGS
jgi:hypothetical protein